MKKLVLIALLGAGVAFASSMSVPWFVDQVNTNVGVPPATVATTVAVVFLHNNQAATVTCAIEYFTQDGVSLGPAAPNNTFTISALSTLAFRPVASDQVDSVTNPLGSEALSGYLVPNRPMISSIAGGAKKNGSLVIKWVGGPGDVQGILNQAQNVDGGAGGRLTMWGTLLPPGT